MTALLQSVFRAMFVFFPILKYSVEIKSDSKAAVQMLVSYGMSRTSNKGITTKHRELNVVWKCNIYIHSFYFNITVLSFVLCFICDRPERLVSKYVMSTSTKKKSFVRFWLFFSTFTLLSHRV